MDNSTTSPPEPTLLPGQSAPLTVITATDQGGVVIIATALALVFALVSVLLRLFVRVEFRHRWSGDDLAAMLSMVLLTIQTALVFAAVSHGLGKTGKDVSDFDVVSWEKYTYASDILYILTLWSTKFSVALLFIRLSPDKTHNLMSYGFLAVSAVLITISVFIVCLRCEVTEPWLVVGVKCPGLFARWQTVASFDISAEIVLFLMAIYIVQGLQLALEKKLVVVFAFGLRLPVIAAAALRLHYLIPYLSFSSSGSDPSLLGTLPTVLSEIELCYAVVATTIPCLRPFMFALSTNYGGPTTAATKSRTGTGYAGGGGGGGTGNKAGYNISLGSMSSGRDPKAVGNGMGKGDGRKNEGKERGEEQLRWDGAGYEANVGTGDQDSMVSNDSRRMIISKNTEVVIDYEEMGPGK